tara:strand:+ start:74 stop:265 length:192 start_codon:yes stop_codon:yes gene_type:complete
MTNIVRVKVNHENVTHPIKVEKRKEENLAKREQKENLKEKEEKLKEEKERGLREKVLVNINLS